MVDLVVGAVTRRATRLNKGVDILDIPRSEMVDNGARISPQTLNVWGLDSLRNAQNEGPLWGCFKHLRYEGEVSKDELKGVPGTIENYQVRPDEILFNVLYKPLRKVLRVVVPELYQSTALRLANSIPVAGHRRVCYLRDWNYLHFFQI